MRGLTAEPGQRMPVDGQMLEFVGTAAIHMEYTLFSLIMHSYVV